MSRKLKPAALAERCAAFLRYRGLRQPRCGCHACWNFYFSKNPTKAAAAALALKTLGEGAVVAMQGKDYADAVIHEQQLEVLAGKRRIGVFSDPATLVQNRGEKYLKHLRNFLAENPELVGA